MNNFDLERFEIELKKLDEEVSENEYSEEEIQERVNELLGIDEIEAELERLETEVRKAEKAISEYGQIEKDFKEILGELKINVSIEITEQRINDNSTVKRMITEIKCVDSEVNYSELSVEDWTRSVPRNNSFGNIYKEYNGFYTYFKNQIENRTLKSLKPYASNFYEWFRGVMAEKEAHLFTSNAYAESCIAGTEIEDVLSDYRYICNEHAPGYYRNAFALLNRCYDKADYYLFYNKWKGMMETSVEKGNVDFIKYVEIVNPLRNEYIPSKLFLSFININSYLTYVGEAYSDEIEELVCDCIEKEYRETQVNFLYQYADVIVSGAPESPKQSIGDRLCLNWLENISEDYEISTDGFSVSRGNINSKKVRRLIKNCENLIRKKNDLPLIGEGWISETILFKQIEAIFEKEQVEKHFSPEFLGKQHYDIYFPEHKIALEYQGVQHFEAIDIFGGEDGLKRTQERDEKKRKLSEDNKVQLIEVLPDYDIRDVVKKICALMNNTNQSIIQDKSILNALKIEETTRKELQSGKDKLKSISRKKEKTYSAEEKEEARNQLLVIKSRFDEGQWVKQWYAGYQITYAELLETSEEEVDEIVSGLMRGKIELDPRYPYSYADLLKKVINYYKKHKRYDKAIDVVQFAINRSIKLQDGKSFEVRLEELQKIKEKEQGK